MEGKINMKLPYSYELLQDLQDSLVTLETKNGYTCMDYFEINNTKKSIYMSAIDCNIELKDINTIQIIDDYDFVYKDCFQNLVLNASSITN